MTLSEIANIVEILSLLSIVFGIFFGIAQIKLSRNQRRDLAILECAHSFEDRDFTEAYRLLSALSPGQHQEDIERLGSDYESAALRVGMKF